MAVGPAATVRSAVAVRRTASNDHPVFLTGRASGGNMIWIKGAMARSRQRGSSTAVLGAARPLSPEEREQNDDRDRNAEHPEQNGTTHCNLLRH